MDLKELLIKIKSETFLTALSASFLLSFTLVFFGPATLYYTNFFEFGYTFSDIFPYLLLMTFLLNILLLGISLVANGTIQKKIICLIFAFGFLFYLQGNILVWDYGLLNGQEIIWNNFLLNGIFESFIWVAVITLSLFSTEKIYKLIPVFCLFLLVIQAGGLIALVHFAPDEPQWKNYSFIEDESKFNFSSNTNVIILVLDGFQSDVFQEIIDENNTSTYMFTGFTYYRNMAGGYPTTIGSIPLILTGEYYNNSVPFDTFIQTSYESSSLPKTLKENGYIVDIYERPRLVYPDENLESNVKKNSFNYQNMTPLTNLTLFRHFPHFLKQVTYPLLIQPVINQDINSDLLFNDQLSNLTIRSDDSPVFKFYHLNGAHPPFRINERLEYEELPNNRSGYIEQSKASLHIVGNFLEKLKENGIFDNSVIIVMADHGTHDKSNGIPLLLIKPRQSTHPLTISDAPVSSSDIPKTVATELNLSNTFTGESVMRVQDSDKRNFSFYDYHWGNEFWYGEYLPTMYQYTINGFSWNASSWKPSYRVYSPKGVETRYPPYYNLGTQTQFGKDQPSSVFLSSGWSTPEEGFVWSDGNSATITFSMNRSNSTLMNLQINASPFIVQNKQEVQRMTVFVNHHNLGDYTFTQSRFQNIEFIILPSYLNNQVQDLTFYFPDAISPSELGISGDERNLAIALFSLSLAAGNVNPIEYGEGWHSPENWSGIQTRWMDSNATLILYSDENQTSMLHMQISSFYRPRTLHISTEGQHDLEVIIPSDLHTRLEEITTPVNLHEGKNTIRITVPEGCQKPSEIPELNNPDSRCLAFVVQNISLV